MYDAFDEKVDFSAILPPTSTFDAAGNNVDGPKTRVLPPAEVVLSQLQVGVRHLEGLHQLYLALVKKKTPVSLSVSVSVSVSASVSPEEERQREIERLMRLCVVCLVQRRERYKSLFSFVSPLSVSVSVSQTDIETQTQRETQTEEERQRQTQRERRAQYPPQQYGECEGERCIP